MKKILTNLLKVWGVQKVMEALIAFLKTQGTSEKTLAEDLDLALEAYKKRGKKL